MVSIVLRNQSSFDGSTSVVWMMSINRTNYKFANFLKGPTCGHIFVYIRSLCTYENGNSLCFIVCIVKSSEER